MTTKKEDPGRDDARPGDSSPARRPHATLDLKATEIEARAEKDQDAAAAAGGGKTQASPSSQAQPEPSNTDRTGDKTATQPDTKAAQVARKRQLASHLAAGLAGGLMALFVAYWFIPGLASSGGSEDVTLAADAVQQRLATLEDSVKQRPFPANLSEKLAASEARIVRLEQLNDKVAKLSEAQAKLASDVNATSERFASNTATETITKRVAKLEDQLAAATNDPQIGRIPQLAGLIGKVTDLESAITNQMNALRADVTQEIEGRIVQVDEASAAAKSGTQRIERELAAIKADAARLNQRVEALKTDGDRLGNAVAAAREEAAASRSALGSLKGDFDAKLRAAVKPDDVAIAVTPLTAKITSLQQQLQGVVKSEEDRKVNAERIVLALELGNLKRALDTGQEYTVELAAVRTAARNTLSLDPLERFKAQGIPTLADLMGEFRATANAMIDADAEPPDGSVVDRLLAGAKSVVRVRKVNQSAGDNSVEAVVGRMEAALKDGRLDSVLEEARKLPPKAANAAGNWLAKVEARAGVDRALATIEGELKASLGGGSGPLPTVPN